MTRWGGGVSQKVIFDDVGGGRGVQTPHKKDDIIYEHPLTGKLLGLHSDENFFSPIQGKKLYLLSKLQVTMI